MKNPQAWDKIASEYKTEVISPLFDAEVNEFWSFLGKISHKNKKNALDLGCGPGNLIVQIHDRFKSVLGIDFSLSMLQEAQVKIHEIGILNVTLQKKNFLSPLNLKSKVDVVLAINSILATHPRDTQKILKNVSGALKRGGYFLGIFPSLESLREEYRHTYYRHLGKTNRKGSAREKTQKELELEKSNLVLGVYHTGDMEQKYYTLYELHAFFREAGIRLNRVGKVIYRSEFSHHSNPQPAVRRPRMWDWVVLGGKG